LAKDLLTEIIQEKKSIIEAKKRKVSLEKLQSDAQEFRLRRSFKEAINKPGRVSLIAEIKQASPSKGIIRKDFNVNQLAVTYEGAGADALSVLTEEKYFKGSLSDIEKIRENCKLPILRKDFILDIYQIYETYISGADAVLLISEVISNSQLSEFLALANNLGLDCLVEASSEDKLKNILRTEAEIIGINNRNLRTFEVNLENSKKLVPLIPKEKIIVVESGIQHSYDIDSLRNLGVNAVLIGEALLRAKDINAKIKQLMG
jgi:indole-3-glycerol phosphate synthase